MLKVGLTGGIGSGKSTVSKIFKVLGIPVFDADKAAKRIMEQDGEVKQQIIELLGEKAYVNNQLNRSYIANIVFADSYKLEKLNSIVHPASIQAANDWAMQQTAPYIVKEAALFFESGSAAHIDYVVGVYAPLPLRIKRVMQRDNVSHADVVSRMSKQINEELKMKLCNYVLHNNEQQLLVPQVIALHHHLLQGKL